MSYLFTFFTALVLSMSIIPLMIRLAPRIGMLDLPDSRKVHVLPIPRVGGMGIAAGALLPLLLWAPLDEPIRAYLFGSLVLFVFGAWDDSRNLNPYLKFAGQIIAASTVVYYADVYIASLPFMDLEPLPVHIAKPFTVFAIVGMINALNVSDGLDGLAGGLSILSLSCIAYLAYLAEGFGAITIVVAVLGGILGFLRYNTHPARVFMGDTGSQFLGFTLGFLTVLFTQKINPAVSPSLALLLLGLPIIDMLAVIAQRIHYGISPLAATKHHLHHRLLELGFDHYEAVVMIYLVQALFVASAVPLSYESDWLIMSLYLGVSGLIYLALYMAIRGQWRAHRSHAVSWLTRAINNVKQHKLFVMIPVRFVAVSIPVFFVITSLMAIHVPRDFSIMSVILLVVLVIFILSRGARDSIVVQVINYVTAAFVVYLETKYFRILPVSMEMVDLVYFVALALAVGLAVRYSGQLEFRTTPTDYLMIFVVLFVGFWLHNLPEKAEIGIIAAKLIVLFYGCEFIISHARRKWNALNLSAVVSLSVLALRGLV
jgi:UDP-GlcNAc:undecaprenyl-phosphate GlcNAc-1-phosphate transferase